MKTSTIVTTNLRIPAVLLQTVRLRAAEEGISANEYMTRLIQEKTLEAQFLPKKDRGTMAQLQKDKEKKNFMERLLEISKLPNEPMGELSPDDKIIYET